MSVPLNILLKKPRMIMFDYGHTLLAELGFSSLRGMEAVMKYVTSNPLNLTVGQVNEFVEGLYEDISAQTKPVGLEINNIALTRLVYEYQRLEFSLSYQELEQVWWDACAPGAYLPHVREMLAFLRENGVRTGIISNMSYSGASMRVRINQFFPEHPFEFIMVSSDYLLRKPARLLFETALRKADLPAEDVWFCGDSVIADIPGAASAGIFPVWYEDLTMRNEFAAPHGIIPEADHLHIHDWLELVDVLRKCEIGVIRQ
ncbi:MAG: HAD family hydrolase [Oscillospiraceae bacterium]|jgi:putative hydrolase of the HAD superfamily|nr:HAD family hydrolase [Oscillospiraceae bacterium]